MEFGQPIPKGTGRHKTLLGNPRLLGALALGRPTVKASRAFYTTVVTPNVERVEQTTWCLLYCIVNSRLHFTTALVL